MWAIVPDIPGNAMETLKRWNLYAHYVVKAGIPLAVAAQDGMSIADVRNLRPMPEMVCIGGSTDWKWGVAQEWCAAFPRVHVLRCNSPTKLDLLEAWGCESTDGTGWCRGDLKQTAGLEAWCRKSTKPMTTPLWPYTRKGKAEAKAALQIEEAKTDG
jgi:hypothetical protein